ncbi:TPA: fertility inhibition protein FinO [Escherichia coli]|nr:fertility inhibition protein FinO [Escherichia coli]
MMSIAQVRSAGSAGNYYTDKDNYYVLGCMGERWAGQGAEQLGLQGSVDKDVFTRLLEGRLPDGADLSRMQDGRNRHRPGYDLTFSAPKSVSMMAMLGGDKRLIEAHIRDVLLEDVAQQNIPLSHKKLRRALKAITRSESYLCAMKAGACRYDTEGYVTEHISQEEEAYAAERLDKIRRQNRIKAELQAVLDEK